MSQKRHYQKVQSKKFLDLKYGNKNFIVVVDNNKYNKGDIVILDEFSGDVSTGKAIARTIRYIDRETDGIEKGYCVLGL